MSTPCLALVVLLVACGDSIEDQIARLGAGGEATERAKLELLIAKGEAVPALLQALEDPGFTAGRAELAEVLVDLMTRIDDDRVRSALKTHLVSDPDPLTRARIAWEVGMLKRRDFHDAFIEAIDDEDGRVRGEALTALCFIRDSMTPEQLETLADKARQYRNDENLEARLGARIIVADRVDVWLQQADSEALQGRIAAAESLYAVALAYAPESTKANLKLGRHYFENGQRERGLKTLRDSNWLLDVPRFESPPAIDGRLEEKVWGRAVGSTPFFAYSATHNAAIRSKVPTVMYAGYTDDALYLATRCEDAHPESLIAVGSERDYGESDREDVVEYFFDTNFDRKTFVRATINSRGAILDGGSELPQWRMRDWSLDLDSAAAAHVGEDYWSVEYRLAFGQPGVPTPSSGTIWGLDAQRGYRGGEEWSQWTRYFQDMSPLDSFGWIRFE